MPTFQVAHVKHEGIDLIIIPLDSSFGYKSPEDQRQITFELQLRANNAGLAGTVVPVWNAPGGQMGFWAPVNWHPFFKSITMQWVWQNINRSLYW